jgi:hypothetical protein
MILTMRIPRSSQSKKTGWVKEEVSVLVDRVIEKSQSPGEVLAGRFRKEASREYIPMI